MKKRLDTKGRLLLLNESEVKNGSYTFRYYDENGLRHTVTRWRLLPSDKMPDGRPYEEESLREVEARLKKSERITLRKAIKSDDCTLDTLWRNWLPQKVEIAESTLVHYIYLYNRHIKEELGSRSVSGFRYRDIKQFYTKKIGEGYSVSIVRNLNDVLNQMFQFAVREGFIYQNPCEGMLAEFRRKKDWESTHRIALTEKQVNSLISYISKSQEYKPWLPIVTILLGTGMRAGELLGLRWEDIDFENSVISITHTMNHTMSLEGKSTSYITYPKSKAGVRDIPMFKDVRETFLDLYKKRGDVNSQNQPIIDGYTNFIFRDLTGGLITQGRINAYLNRVTENYNILERAKAIVEKRPPNPLPHITCHNLRHTFCTLLAANKVSLRTIQLLMGHAYPETTLKVYTQATEALQKKEIEAIDGAFQLK